MSISLIVGTLITGITIWIILSYLLVPPRFTFPISIFMSSLSFGLIKYYFISFKNNVDVRNGSSNDSSNASKNIDADRNKIDGGLYFSNIIFVLVFLVSLVICLVFSKPDLEHIYKSWYTIEIIDLVTLGAGIILSFFLPGYAVLHLLTKRHRVNPVLKVLIAYLISMLITGLTIYLSEIFFDNDAAGNKTLLIGVYAAILTLFVISYGNKIILTNTNRYHISYEIVSNIYAKFLNALKINFSEILVFASFFALLIVSTNYLYGGITIGDQWYHQNRALYFLSGQFKEYVLTNGDYAYPPLQSALIAGATMLSGIPLINTYASIAFLNITAVFAFYYFCSTWFPNNSKRAALLASSLFLISSGFGWVYMLSLTETNPIASQVSSISNFLDDKIKFTDIIRPANFMIAAHPDFSTALIYISLPAGFVLLGLVRSQIGNKLCYTIIFSLVSIVGILSHDEFYFFIITSSTLPLIYNMQKKYSVYFALLIALAFTYTIDALLPVRYFTTNAISGFPLIQLSTLFTLLMLSLYILRQNLHKRVYFLRNVSLKSEMSFTDNTRIINLIPKAILVGIIFYLYALGFIVWDELPANLVNMHTEDYKTPWYMYSIRLGIIGIIGVVSILSYVFRKFEKEVFIFGLIIIFALFAGPYYDEQRFNKYVMAGMIGFASLFIFKLVHFVAGRRPTLNGIILSSLIISASLSTLMYIGYNSLVIETGDYTHALGRRNFPSEQEMNMLEVIRSKIYAGSNQYNIASYPNEYNPQEGGVMTKLHAFSGLPVLKIPQTHYLLNASTLESFYNLIEKSNTKYILIPSNSINQLTLGDPARFAFENFQHIYDDHNYLLVNVPSLHGPSTPTESEVGIIYKKDNSFATPVFDKKKLLFSNYTFNPEENDTKFIYVQKENQSEKATLYGYKKQGGKTIWSNNFEDPGINYIDSMFRIRGENKTGQDAAGIKWREGNATYTVSVSNKGLELRRHLSSDDEILLLSQNSEIKRNDWVWYSLKIENLEDSINVYADNLLKIKIPRELPGKPTGISKVAIYSVKNAVEFEPIQVAKIVPSEELLQRITNYENYYPISSLALSGNRYSTFVEGDYSVLSKNIIVLPFDPQNWNDTKVNNYLNYVKSGGTLVVINSNGNFVGSFGKLLSMQVRSNTPEKFIDVVRENDGKVLLNVSGFARDIDMRPSNDTNVIAYYRNDLNKLMKPFAIEKHFTNSGRIIYINSEGYFNAIYNNPKKHFASLANFSDLINSTPHNLASILQQNISGPINQFIGHADMSGKISINSSSFSINNASENSHNITVRAVSILDKYGNLKNHFENLSIINMKLSGQYEVSIDSSGTLTMPGSLTDHDYLQISLPNEFNMTLTLLDNKNSHVEVLGKNNSSIDTVEVNDESKVVFYKVNSGSPLNSVPVIIKNPLIVVDGNLKFEKRNIYGGTSYFPLNLSGHAAARFDFIDNFKESNGTRTRIQYLGNLGSLTLDGKIKEVNPTFKLPGDISSDLKKRGLDVPLISILGSLSNIALVIAVSIGTIILIWFIRRVQLNRS